MLIAFSFIGSLFSISKALIPEDAESGLALKVPLWAILLFLLKSGSSIGYIIFIISAFPHTAPPGSPPPSIFANVVKSGVTP